MPGDVHHGQSVVGGGASSLPLPSAPAWWLAKPAAPIKPAEEKRKRRNDAGSENLSPF